MQWDVRCQLIEIAMSSFTFSVLCGKFNIIAIICLNLYSITHFYLLKVCMLFSRISAQFCPSIWDPVCGANPLTRSVRTFSNLCELENNKDSGIFGNYRFLHRGECERNINSNEDSTGLTSINGDNRRELLVCPPIYQPVCAVDRRNGRQRTFSSECVLIHESLYYEFLHEGVCHAGPQACTLQYDPVCAARVVDGVQKNFANECLLRVDQTTNPYEHYELLHQGECKYNEYQETQPFGRSHGEPIEREVISPNNACPLIWRPVCGVRLSDRSQKTFSNECFLRNQTPIWNLRGRYIFLHEGECGQTCNREQITNNGDAFEEHDHQDHEQISFSDADDEIHSESSCSSHSESDAN